MRDVLLQRAIKLNRNHKQRKWWQRAVRILAMAVVFCTTYALILPAITMEEEAVCGKEAHVHEKGCYAEQPVPVLKCSPGDGVQVVHSHSELCYDEQNALICTLPEIKEHIHDDSCYVLSQEPVCGYNHEHGPQWTAVETVLSCGMEALEAHVHSQDCTTELVLICGLQESGGHAHTETCGTTKTVLVCTEQEVAPHVHGEACYQLTEVPCQQEHEHGEGCAATETILVCTKTEEVVHTHGEACYQTEQVPCQIPVSEGHAHSDSCYERREIPCTVETQPVHQHTDACYTQQEVPCDKPTTQEHVHEESCYEKTLNCGLEEVKLHTHGEACYDAEQNLICQQPQVVEHTHTESCFTQQAGQTLVCQLEEHTHEDSCYPVEEEGPEGIVYICGMGVHTHTVEDCTDGAGNLTCTIPGHTHEARCIVADLDMTADVETEQDWQAMADALTLTGNWPEDLVAVAKTQIGYRESEKNVRLEGEQLKGYTRYGAWCGEPYGDWNGSFVSFCLHYAGIDTFPTEPNCVKWIEKLTEAQCFVAPEGYTPKTGDLVFFGTEQEDMTRIPDRVAIVAELVSATETEPAKIKIIEGDCEGEVKEMTCDLADAAIVGYGILPENPMPQEQWVQAMQVKGLIAELPSVENAQEAFQTLQEQRDKAGHEALRQELTERLDTIYSLYETFNDNQKELAGSIALADALKELCGGEVWQDYPALTEDGAVISALTCGQVELIPVPTEPAVQSDAAEETEAIAETGTDEENAAEPKSETAIHDGDTAVYSFTLEAQSYYTDISYGQARAKVELVLPLTQDKALFDQTAMTWLEEAHLRFETRTIGENLTICQVLTGYVSLEQDEKGIAVPGSFTGEVPVKVVNMAHGEKLSVIISVAMEHGTWDGICQTHEIEEKLTVKTVELTVDEPLSAEQQDAIYQNYVRQIDSIAVLDLALEERRPLASLLLDQVVASYKQGGLSDSEMEALGDRLRELLGYYAEYATGISWMLPAETEQPVLMRNFALARSISVPQTRALAAEISNDLSGSGSQIDKWGSENFVASEKDGQVFVNKTIEGTDIENVFDITLEVITVDSVNSVYEDPDMAVVVVMDISETMNSKFPSTQTRTSRYDAAMTAGQHFLETFADAVADDRTLSKVGYVAFNTNAHKVFDLSKCSTAADAASLNTTMRSKTKAIMDNAAKDNSDKKYSSSHERFTNMQAGLQMAADMLAEEDNRNKYIIFITDGFPTTYLKSYTAGADEYYGYDPYTGSGTIGNNGVFYDAVRNKYCTYGTSYSDTAAIKARQLAVSLKESGVNIFSIGVDVASQTIKYYHDSYYDDAGNAKAFSVVERRKEASYYNSTGYEIGTLHSEITKANPTTAEKNKMAQDFKDWLGGSATTGIGSGYYYDSTNLSQLEAAYETIFAEIRKLNASSAKFDWIASDPMPGMGVHELDTIEFIGFWDLQGNLVQELKGQSGANSNAQRYENTATFGTIVKEDGTEQKNTISWDLKNSGYNKVPVSETSNNYHMALSYRVRLKNEKDNFTEIVKDSSGNVTAGIYDTNDITSLSYRIIDKDLVTGEMYVSEDRSVDFPIPAVHGYLAELSFKKVGPDNNALAGAEFTLSHDPICSICRGDGVSAVPLNDMVQTSGQDGMVTFTKIPSGHKYILTETKVPDEYIPTENTYKIEVAYDALTVTVTDAEGNPLVWTESIQNGKYYELPHTGGNGTFLYHAFGGLLLMAGACVYSVTAFGRKRQKGGARRGQ